MRDKPCLRDRVAAKVIAWCIHVLPTRETSERLSLTLDAGAAVLLSSTINHILAEEQERKNRPNT